MKHLYTRNPSPFKAAKEIVYLIKQHDERYYPKKWDNLKYAPHLRSFIEVVNLYQFDLDELCQGRILHGALRYMAPRPVRFRDRLEREMRRLGVTDKQLSVAIKRDLSTFSGPKTTPKLDIFLDICEALELYPSHLLEVTPR